MNSRYLLPITYPEKTLYFPEALEIRLNEYISYISSINCDDEIIKSVKEFSKAILDSINYYFIGKTNKAYLIFSNELNKNLSGDSLSFIKELGDKLLYRARIEDEFQEKDFKNIDFFHIKFEERTKVKNQRYSISGLPCLYLAESVYGCWLEIQKPKLDVFSVASIKTKKEIQIFDLCYLYSILEKNDIFEIKEYAKILPILIACSFPVKKKYDEFKPEYIIPHFILEWILDYPYSIHGLKFFGVSNHINIKYERLFTNYAFPVRSIKKSGICSNLEGNFSVEKILNGREAQYYQSDKYSNLAKVQPISAEKIQLFPGIEVDYNTTVFGIFENLLTTANSSPAISATVPPPHYTAP